MTKKLTLDALNVALQRLNADLSFTVTEVFNTLRNRTASEWKPLAVCKA